MEASDKLDIQRIIDCYFKQDATIDLERSTDSFPKFCVSRIWIYVCNRHILSFTDKYIEDLIEALHDLSGIDVIPIQEISSNPKILRLKLENGTWYIYKWSEKYFYVIPEWEGPREVPRHIGTYEEAELMIKFDKYIPQILAWAQELVLKHKEQETACEIIKASAEGLINTLLSEGIISLRKKADIYCPAPNRIEIILDDSTKWLCTSLNELRGLLLRRYGTK